MELVHSYTHFDRNTKSQFLSLHIFMAAQHFPFQYHYCGFVLFCGVASGRRCHFGHRSCFAAGLAGSLHPLAALGRGRNGTCSLGSENLLDMESGCVLRKKENGELDKKVTGSETEEKSWELPGMGE